MPEFDHHDKDFARDPYPVYERLRRECPVNHSDAWGGFWSVSTYADCASVLHDDDTFRSGDGVSVPKTPGVRRFNPIETDPPQFYGVRRALNPFFSPAAVARMEPQAREIAHTLIDGFIAAGEVDLVAALARPLPGIMTMRILGLEDDLWERYVENAHIAIHSQVQDFDRAVEVSMETYAELAVVLEERQSAGAKGDDIISYLLRAQVDGKPLSEEDILDICILLLYAGLDTTTAAIGHLLHYMGRNPAVRQQLIERPELIPLAVEESLRLEAPVQALSRTVGRDVVVGDQELREGDKLLILFASANRDANEFDRPDEFVVDRYPNRHMAFGVGIHRCLGAHFGRMESQVALEAVLERIPDYQLISQAAPQRFDDCAIVYGLVSLPVSFSASPKGAQIKVAG